MSDYRVREASDSDLDALLAVQRDGFTRVAEELAIPHDRLPPLNESAERLRGLQSEGWRFFLAETPDGKAIGTVRAHGKDGVVEVGRLAVAGAWLRQGVATALMDAVETAYPAAARFVLFTGAEARAPLQLYLRRGYVETRREPLGEVELVWLEKSAGDSLR